MHQPLDGGELAGEGRELTLYQFEAALDLADLLTGLGEQRPQWGGELRIGILDQRPDRRYHLPRPHGDEHALLAKQAAQGVEPCGPLSQRGP